MFCKLARARRAWTAVVAAVLVAVSLGAGAQAAPATVYGGGTILTMAGDTPQYVEALAVRDGRILAVGQRAAVEKAAGRGARRVDLAGRTLLPGFIDGHGHVTSVGQAAGFASLAPPPVGGVASMSELQAVLTRFTADRAIAQGAPVVGVGYDDSQLVERRHPTRQDLDQVSASHPVLVMHVSGHLASANSAMLALMGIGPDTPDPKGGHIRRMADGRTPNGVLEETALAAALAYVLPRDLDAAVAATVAGQKIYMANGITTAQDGRVMPEAFPGLAEAARRGDLPLDTVVLISFDRDWPEAVRQQIGKPYSGRMRIGGVKLSLDGSPQGRTAWLHDPVPVPPDGKDAGYRGYPAMDTVLFRERLVEARANNWQVFVHVNGDEAAQALIDGVREVGLAGRRTIAIHAQVVRPEQLTDFKTLDIQPSFFASHTWFWGDWHREVALGPARGDFISPQASAWQVGLRPTAHNDSPVVPPDIMRLLWSSVNRRTQSGDILGPRERISVYRALQQVTLNAAWQINEESDKGSLEPGKRADLVILDANPLAVEPMALTGIHVVATSKDGEVIFGGF
ncbi:MAG: amidohydrolase [Caulobacter sp.]|nr:amidohydrolase [Caulobacter sp.]